MRRKASRLSSRSAIRHGKIASGAALVFKALGHTDRITIGLKVLVCGAIGLTIAGCSFQQDFTPQVSAVMPVASAELCDASRLYLNGSDGFPCIESQSDNAGIRIEFKVDPRNLRDRAGASTFRSNVYFCDVEGKPAPDSMGIYDEWGHLKSGSSPLVSDSENPPELKAERYWVYLETIGEMMPRPGSAPLVSPLPIGVKVAGSIPHIIGPEQLRAEYDLRLTRMDVCLDLYQFRSLMPLYPLIYTKATPPVRLEWQDIRAVLLSSSD
jgi:hypothetical protein